MPLVYKADGTSCLQLTIKSFTKLYIIDISYIYTCEIMRRGGKEREREKRQENGEILIRGNLGLG